jgi:3-oxoadipate enol-lactonase
MAIAQGMQALAPTAITRFFSERFLASSPEIADIFRQRMLTTTADGYAGCCAVLRDTDFTGQLGAIALPTIVIGGTLDVPTPLSQAEELVRAIPGARLVALDAGHLSNVEQPNAFAAAIRRILETT